MRFTGLAFRAHNPYWSFAPTSGEGAKERGGRFNPKGTPALYLSLGQTTALAEYNQGFPHRPQPTTLCAYEIDCEAVIDLTDANTRKEVGTNLTEMACGWELLLAMGKTPPTWTLARQQIAQGAAGVLVPSYARNAPAGSRNLVLWRWGDNLPHRVALIDDEGRLPRNQDSWPD